MVRPGLLAQADGGLLLVSMAERMSDAVAARIASVMDTGEVVIERDGATARQPARFGLVLLDDGQVDERVPDRLAERCAFRFDLSEVCVPADGGSDFLGTKKEQLSSPTSTGAIKALAAAAFALGIDTSRATILALRAARGLADVAGRAEPDEADLATAARLILAHRATRMPGDAQDDAAPPPPPSPDQGEPEIGDTLDDVVLEAVTAALPPDVLAAIAAGSGRRSSNGSGGGERRKSPMRGRPLGARAGLPRGGARLALIDTLRAAAPWQKMRGGAAGDRIAICRDDLRIKRFETRADATTIFAVDASGSAAVARLGEAKGAVELLLAEAYVKRTEVALIAFRGDSAEVLLPPTRSLTRARRSLADLPGGGGTPLAAGIDAARLLGEAVKGKGRTPFVVFLSDGRGNVGAEATMPAAKAFGASGLGAVFVDISSRPRQEGAELAAAMNARYLPLPRADAAGLAGAVKAIQ
jgi:magnesium chelatase subunit D